MKQYDSYKDSGVEWIGEVPSHWSMCKLKHLAKVFGRIGFRGYNQTDLVSEGEGAITLSPSNMQNGKMDYDKCSYLSWHKYNESPEIMIENGDILFVKTGSTYGKVSYVDYLPMEATINPQIVVFKNIKGNNKYLFYLLSNEIVQGQVSLTVGGSTIPTLSQESILNYIVPVAPPNEQTIIAAYLDKKCSEIDNVISAQQKRIALLQELKQSVITHAVTKGLDPNVKMKESGVEWIDKIPADWEVLPLKRFGKMNKGLTFTKADIVDEGNPAISYGQVHSKSNDGVCLKEDLIRFVPDTFVLNAKKSIAYQGDFIFADTSEDFEGCGNCVYNDTGQPIYGGYHTIVLQTGSTDAKYLAYLFRTDYWRYQIRSRVYGVKVYSITQSILSLCSIIMPPMKTQKSIVAFLDKKCEEINLSIDKAFAQINLLQELKLSLITEVVTGKRKVC